MHALEKFCGRQRPAPESSAIPSPSPAQTASKTSPSTPGLEDGWEPLTSPPCGLSGDTACTDYIIAWKVRHQLHLDNVSMGASPDHNDNMILDFKDGKSSSGFGHPDCKGGMEPSYIIQSLSKKFPTGSGKKQD